MKKFIIIIIVLAILLTAVGAVIFKLFSEKTIPINNTVSNILSEKGIKKSRITFLCSDMGDDFGNEYYKVSSNVTEEELEAYVDDLLVSHEKMVEITDRNIVQNRDAVVISYVVYYNSELVASAEKETLMVGTGNYFKELEDAIVGAIVGEPFSCILKSPIDTEKYKKGESLKYNITVESINRFESYASSDKYILDYYGVETEQEFLKKCEVRLKQIKKQENQYIINKKLIDEIAEHCKFYINKIEAAKYSKTIFDKYNDLAYINGLELNDYITQTLNISEDEFYDFCYNEGVKDIKRHLVVGACTSDTTFDNKNYSEFCSLNGFSSKDANNTQARYAYLEAKTIIAYGLFVTSDIAYLIPFEKDLDYSVSVYNSSNIYNINFSTNKGYNLQKNKQEEFMLTIKNILFGEMLYQSTNDSYQTVIILKKDNKIFETIMVDQINGYVKWHQNDGRVVCAELSSELNQLIEVLQNQKQ